MPQMRGLLNAIRRKVMRGRVAGAHERRLSPAQFLKTCGTLAEREPVPPGLWLSLLDDRPESPLPLWERVRVRGNSSPKARLGAPSPRPSPARGEGALAERVALDPETAGSQTRWLDALRRARAPYVARFQGPGRLAPFGLERIAAALAANPGVWALYTDEVHVGANGAPFEIVLKPAFDPVMLDGFDYFGRLAVYDRERLLALGGWRFDGPAGDHDIALRFAQSAPPGAILHLPYPAYLGPEPPRETATEPVLRRYERAGRRIGFATGLAPDRLRPILHPAPRDWPKIGIVVPSRDAPQLIGALLQSLASTDYPDFEIVVIDNGSTDPRTLALYERHRADPRFQVEIEPAPFNFARAVNRGAALTDAPLLLLLNNDIEIVEPGWLKEMVGCLDYPHTGIVGAKLIYPNGRLQHAGVIAGLGGYAGHWHVGKPENDFGPQRRLAARQSLSVVTGACMLVTRECFEAVGGFDDATFAVAYNDVDFCLRAGAKGFRVVWTPFAKLVHHESVSRGADHRPENVERFAREKAALSRRHGTATLEDRAYNPWALRGHSDPWPAPLDALPPARP
jgi:GT2 family glycosyltransferase